MKLKFLKQTVTDGAIRATGSVHEIENKELAEHLVLHEFAEETQDPVTPPPAEQERTPAHP